MIGKITSSLFAAGFILSVSSNASATHYSFAGAYAVWENASTGDEYEVYWTTADSQEIVGPDYIVYSFVLFGNAALRLKYTYARCRKEFTQQPYGPPDWDFRNLWGSWVNEGASGSTYSGGHEYNWASKDYGEYTLSPNFNYEIRFDFWGPYSGTGGGKYFNFVLTQLV